MSLTPEQMANREKLVAALRSGEYKQGKHDLVTSDGYCCLGVAGKLAGRTDEELRRMNFTGVTGIVGTYLDERTALLFGFGETPQRALAKMNDAGKPFTEIADFIEQETREGR